MVMQREFLIPPRHGFGVGGIGAVVRTVQANGEPQIVMFYYS